MAPYILQNGSHLYNLDVLLWWLEKVPKNISQMVVKHGDLPWDRIRKRSPTKQMEEMGPMTN